MLRFITAAALITAIALLSFNIVTDPLQAKIANNYLALAKQDIQYGKWDDALTNLDQAANMSGAQKEEIDQLKADVAKAQTDLFAEKALLSSYGNTNKVAILNEVLHDYETPKEMLAKALELYQNGEARYAQILLDRAAKNNPDYSGVAEVQNYFNKQNGV